MLQGCETVGFERYMRLRRMGGNHCHINLVPISRKAADSARSTFEQLAQQEGFSFYHIPTDRCAKHRDLQSRWKPLHSSQQRR